MQKLRYSIFLKARFILIRAGLIRLTRGLYLLVEDKTLLLEYKLFMLQREEIIIVILLDWISMIFISVVLIISSLIIIYSEGYIKRDMNKARFVYLIFLFVFSIILLIVSPNLIRILLGWDGLGLISYCLVIYYQNYKSYNAGILTALRNRLGDVAILLRITWIRNYGRFNYLNYLVIIKEEKGLQLLLILVSIAALTKRAQIPFSAWLPAAMAAPTPVSSLVHSSTLVTAGVYLLVRFHYAFEARIIREVLIVLGVLTIFISGLGANFENDLKKIVALSTLSQLGLIVGTLGLGYPQLAYFHLLTHAVFKALLFICAGSIIHSAKNYQDLRVIAGVIRIKPLTGARFLVSNLSLCGFPFLAGFYSKDLILEIIRIRSIRLFMRVLFYVSTGLTVIYTYRLVHSCFNMCVRFEGLRSRNDNDYYINLAMLGLVGFSLIGGRCLNWLLLSYPSIIYLPFYLKLSVLICVLRGAWLGRLRIIKIYKETFLFQLSFNQSIFIGEIWFLPILRTWGIRYKRLYLGEKNLKFLDQGWYEQLGGRGVNYFALLIRSKASLVHRYGLKLCFTLCMIWIVFAFIIFYTFYLNSLFRAWYWSYQGENSLNNHIYNIICFITMKM